MEIERLEVAKLIGDPANARKHNERNIDAIVASLARFGQQKPIVIDKANVVRAGNGTLQAARSLGWTHVDCVRSKLDGADASAYAIADNRTAELAEWDDDVLAATLEGLQLEGMLDVTGFDDDELAELLKQVGAEVGEVVEDEVPEPPADPITKPGDLWILGNHRLLCGDSTNIQHVERLMDGQKADMVFTDPPYGVAYEGGHNDKKRQQIQNDALEGKDLTSLFHGALTAAITVTAEHAPFYVWFASGKSVETFAAFAELPLKLRAVIQWYKVRSGLGAFMSQYIPNCKPCIYAFKAGCSPQWYGPTDEKTVWELQKESRNEFHPTQKPVELPERAINNSSKKGQLVLDLFGGSGSTLIACERQHRHARLMELDPAYCDVIVKRWETLTGKKAVLDGHP